LKRFLLIFILVWATACNNSGLKEYSFSGKIFGTYYRVKGFSEKDFEHDKLKKEIDQYLTYLNLIFSTYEKDSELSKLNRYFDKRRVGLSQELYDVLKMSFDIYQETNGYFDVTVGPIVNAWGFGPDGVQKKPSENEISKLSTYVGMDKVTLFPELAIQKALPNTYIDLSAIAKGYAVDKLADFLQQKSFKSLIVEIGGEVKAIGVKEQNQKYKVGIEKPELAQTGAIINVVALKDMSLATSGSYRNYKKYQDKIFSHTIDPKTFRPAMNKVISVSVLHESCAKADAYATAFMAMGAKKSLEFANNNELGIYIIVKNEDKIDILTSNYFPKKELK
jgi:thiamine biosynthesis lipoprotein